MTGFIPPWIGGDATPREGAGGLAHRPPARLDPWPAWVRGFVTARRHTEQLVPEFRARCKHVAQSYTDAYFLSRDKHDQGLRDLAHRTFSKAALERKESGPNEGQTPFELFVIRCFEGKLIRNWTFYNRRSITRQVLHETLEWNLASSKRLRWQHNIALAIHRALTEHATQIPAKRGQPLWTFAYSALGERVDPETLRERMREHPERTPEALALLALEHLGAATHSLLIDLVVEALGGPPPEDVVEPDPPQAAQTAWLAAPLREAYARLSTEDQELLVAVGQGLSHDEVIARYPRYKDRPRLSEALNSLNAVFVQLIAQTTDAALPALTPQKLTRRIFWALMNLKPPSTASQDDAQ